jgi:hypothetical protein
MTRRVVSILAAMDLQFSFLPGPAFAATLLRLLTITAHCQVTAQPSLLAPSMSRYSCGKAG